MTTSLLTLEIPLVTQWAVFFSSADVVTIFYRWYQIKEFWRYIEDKQYRDEILI